MSDDDGAAAEARPTLGAVVREEAVTSLVSNLVYLGVAVVFALAVANRDWFHQHSTRVPAALRAFARRWRLPDLTADARSQLARDLDRFQGRGEHHAQ